MEKQRDKMAKRAQRKLAPQSPDVFDPDAVIDPDAISPDGEDSEPEANEQPDKSSS